jgi:hypothetical protein
VGRFHVDVAGVNVAVGAQGVEHGCFGVRVGPSVDAHEADVEPVLDVPYAGDVARGSHRLDLLDEAADGSAQRDVASVVEDLHDDLVGVDARVVRERLHDGAVQDGVGHGVLLSSCSITVGGAVRVRRPRGRGASRRACRRV